VSVTKIDLKDKKILYELDLNCRQSNTQIGKKVGLKRDAVAYRINRMQEEGIILYFSTVIDAFKLGYDVLRLYFQYQDIPIQIKEKMIEDLENYENSWAVYSVTGPFDLGAVIWVNNILEFFRFYNKFLDNYSKYIAQKIVSLYVQADEYEKSYLLSSNSISDIRKIFSIVNDGTRIDIDQTDYTILNNIVLSARIPLIDLSKILDISSQAINYRLINLERSGVIKGYRVEIDVSKVGLQYLDVRFNLRDHSQRMKIIKYLTQNPYFKCLNTTVGYTDIETEMLLENLEQLTQIIDDLMEKFPEAIRNYFYLRTRETHRERWLPKMILSK
jgi:Lrp/AsnC family leucine-responsive transcriptional regulator